MNLYLVRHGRTDTFDKGIIQSPDTPLGEYGLSQAKRMAKKLKLVNIDHIYTSDFPRALQTATQISKLTSITVKTHLEVREKIKNTSLDGAPLDGEINLRFTKERQENTYNLDWKFDGQGESTNDLLLRAQKVIDFLISDHTNDSVVIVSHAYFIEAFLAKVLLGTATDKLILAEFMKNISVENASITSLKYNPNKKSWRLLTLNDFSHLKDNWISTHNDTQ